MAKLRIRREILLVNPTVHYTLMAFCDRKAATIPADEHGARIEYEFSKMSANELRGIANQLNNEHNIVNFAIVEV